MTIKLCKECKYYKPVFLWYFIDRKGGFSRCTHVDYSDKNLVTGNQKPAYAYCDAVRQSSFMCGSAGKHFEAKS